MRAFRLLVLIKHGLVERYYERRSDAQASYDNTYSFLRNKPTYKIEEVEILNHVETF